MSILDFVMLGTAVLYLVPFSPTRYSEGAKGEVDRQFMPVARGMSLLVGLILLMMFFYGTGPNEPQQMNVKLRELLLSGLVVGIGYGLTVVAREVRMIIIERKSR